MTTQQKPDTSREGLLKLADDCNVRAIATDALADALLFAKLNEALRALASPSPVEGLGLETTEQERAEWRRLADDAPMWSLSGSAVRHILRDFNEEHARANSLAAEVERLKAAVAEKPAWLKPEREQIGDLATENAALKAELARLTAPLTDGEVEKSVIRMVNRAMACRLTGNTIMAEEFEGNHSLLRRLSAALAQREEELSAMKAPVEDGEVEALTAELEAIGKRYGGRIVEENAKAVVLIHRLSRASKAKDEALTAIRSDLVLNHEGTKCLSTKYENRIAETFAALSPAPTPAEEMGS